MSGTGGRQPYRKGALFERQVAAWLRGLGCLVVRATGSKGDPESSAFDLVSIIASEATLVECKLNGRLDPEPRRKLIEAARKCGAKAVLAKPDKKRKGVIVFDQLYAPERPLLEP